MSSHPAEVPGEGIQRSDFPHFESILRKRRGELAVRLRESARRGDAEGYEQIAGSVHDLEDESLADLLTDVSLAEVDREVQELRAVDAALQRIALGTYGNCVGCTRPIERARLEAFPTAIRCAKCQRAWEHEHATPPTPSL